MTKDEIIKKINEIICDYFENDNIVIDGSDDVEKLIEYQDTCDSLFKITIFFTIMDYFNIEIPTKDAIKIKTFNEFADKIIEYLK